MDRFDMLMESLLSQTASLPEAERIAAIRARMEAEYAHEEAVRRANYVLSWEKRYGRDAPKLRKRA